MKTLLMMMVLAAFSLPGAAFADECLTVDDSGRGLLEGWSRVSGKDGICADAEGNEKPCGDVIQK